MNNYIKLQSVLREIFEIDKADLDFGIYRIMNQKRDDINKFIDAQLPKDIKEILSKSQSIDSVQLQQELDKVGKGLDDAGVLRENSPKYVELKKALETSVDVSAMEQEIFSHLSSFFKRYYNEGDFISQRRYKKDVYAIPYEGEEVKLHWANADQYYIKTSEYLKDYAFVLPNDKKVVFQLKEASTEQNNNKTQGDGERRFAIYEEMPIEIDGKNLYINFTYELHKKTVKQDALMKDAFKTISSNIPVAFAEICEAGSAPTEKNRSRTLIEKHLNDYVSRNTFDYFIHKDLGGFLRRELDFYIKNEILFIDDINTESPAFFTAQLSKIKAFKTVADKIITFLAQIEDFQKKLWLKKKFVIRTDYCITIDRIPEKYHPEIVENKAQIEEWKDLFNVKVSKVEDLDKEKFLVLDTKHFSDEFKDKLIAEFYNLDEETNGLLINSENFQALSLMQEKYYEKIKVKYIDPPYNTGEDYGFHYKDGFSHSSWLSLIENRLRLSNNLLKDNGAFYSSIDDKELDNLGKICNDVFGQVNFVNIITVKTKLGGVSGSSEGKSLKDVTEFIYCYAKNKTDFHLNPVYLKTPLFKYVESYVNEGKSWKYTSVLVKLTDKVLIEENKDKGMKFYGYKTIETMSVKQFAIKSNITEEEVYNNYADKIFRTTNAQSSVRGTVMSETNQHDYPVYSCEYIPIKGRNQGKKIEVLYRGENRNMFMFLSDVTEKIDGEYYYLDKVSSLWDDIEYNNLTKEGNTEFSNGKKPLKLIERVLELSSDKNSIVLDYFAGSGTTGHAVMNLNKKDNGNRKYLMVEMGSFFNSTTKPRLKNSIYAENWSSGKPQDKDGVSQLFKYQVLESYEDTLNNLVLAQTDLSKLGFDEDAQEEYLLQYMLDVESRDHLFNVEIFRNPFDYKLKVSENNELIPTKVDLVETFNFLIGLYVEHIQRRKDIKFVEGTTREGVKTLVIWRNLETTTNKETEEVFRRLFESEHTKEFDQIYINGDHNLTNFRTGENQFKVKMIEETFFNKMFNVNEL